MIHRKRARKTLRRLQNRLRLEGWEITLQFNEDESWDQYGAVAMADGGRRATIILNVYQEEADVEHTLIHELSHLLVYPLGLVLRHWRAVIGEDVQGVYDTQLFDGTEQVVEHLEQIFKRMLKGC